MCVEIFVTRSTFAAKYQQNLKTKSSFFDVFLGLLF